MAAAEVRGSATGTRQFDCAGGRPSTSRPAPMPWCWPAAAASACPPRTPVVDWLAARGYGFQTGSSRCRSSPRRSSSTSASATPQRGRAGAWSRRPSASGRAGEIAGGQRRRRDRRHRRQGPRPGEWDEGGLRLRQPDRAGRADRGRRRGGQRLRRRPPAGRHPAGRLPDRSRLPGAGERRAGPGRPAAGRREPLGRQHHAGGRDDRRHR